MTTHVVTQSPPLNNTLVDTTIKKRCSVCGELLPLTEEFFNKKSRKYGSRDGFRADCKECRNKKRRGAFKKNPSHYREYREEYDKNNPDKVKKHLDNLKKNNKHTPEEWEKIKEKNRLKMRKELLKRKAKKANKDPIVDVFGNKKCSKCGELKPNTEEFFRFRTDYAKPELSNVCIDCDLKRSETHRKKLIKTSSPLFKRLSEYEEMRADPNDKSIGQIRCAYCGKWIMPKYGHVKSRLSAIDNINMGECRIYCEGDQCREACPTYKRQAYPKGFRKNTSREVDPLIRQMCMERDNYTCIKCGAHGEGVTLHAHHILSYARNKIVANDIENVVTLCKACHNNIHKQADCKYHELRCG